MKELRVSTCWILSLPRPDMEHCIRIGKFGLRLSRLISSVKENDRLVFYVTKEKRVIALGEVKKGYYKGKGEIFHAPGLFEHRFNFEASRLDPEIDFHSLIHRLKLTKNATNWGGVLRLGIARMPEDDWKLLNQLSAGKETVR